MENGLLFSPTHNHTHLPTIILFECKHAQNIISIHEIGMCVCVRVIFFYFPLIYFIDDKARFIYMMFAHSFTYI